jgi:hypothetical protein
MEPLTKNQVTLKGVFLFFHLVDFNAILLCPSFVLPTFFLAFPVEPLFLIHCFCSSFWMDSTMLFLFQSLGSHLAGRPIDPHLFVSFVFVFASCVSCGSLNPFFQFSNTWYWIVPVVGIWHSWSNYKVTFVPKEWLECHDSHPRQRVRVKSIDEIHSQ